MAVYGWFIGGAKFTPDSKERGWTGRSSTYQLKSKENRVRQRRGGAMSGWCCAGCAGMSMSSIGGAGVVTSSGGGVLLLDSVVSRGQLGVGVVLLVPSAGVLFLLGDGSMSLVW